MKKLFLIAGLAASLAACSSQPYKLSANDIQYIEDQRSGLCFAVVNAHSNKQQIGMTTVDCNDVEDLLTSSSLPVTTTQNTKPVEKPRIARNYYNINPVFSISSF